MKQDVHYVERRDKESGWVVEEVTGFAERQASLVREAEDRGLIGPRSRQMGGRFAESLVEQAKRVSGISENTELLTYALMKVAMEDDFGERLLARSGRVPRGTFFAE